MLPIHNQLVFNRYSDFAKTPAAVHPGQPVHCAEGFDVWQDPADRKFFVIPAGGEPVKSDKLEDLIDAARKALEAAPPPTPEQLDHLAKHNSRPVAQRYAAAT